MINCTKGNKADQGPVKLCAIQDSRRDPFGFLSISNDLINRKYVAPLPDFPLNNYNNQKVNHLGNQQRSDVVIDSDNNVYYAFHHSSMKNYNNCFYIFVYDQIKKVWKTYTIKTHSGVGLAPCMYLWKDNLYVGIFNYNEKFKIYLFKPDFFK